MNGSVATVADAPRMFESADFEVRRAFAHLDMRLVDRFLFLDHMGASKTHQTRRSAGRIICIFGLKLSYI